MQAGRYGSSMPEDELQSAGPRRLSDFPERARHAIARLRRVPADFADTNARVAALEVRVDELRRDASASTAALTDHLEAISHAVHSLQKAVGLHRAMSAEAWRQLGTTTSALVAAQAAHAVDPPMPDADLVSIILPVRARPMELRRAVASVLAQSHAGWELLIVDDGAHDQPAAVAIEDLLSDPRVRVVRGVGLGAASARNQGIREARGEIVAFLDSDNWWFPGRIETILRELDPETAWAVDQQLVLAAWPAIPHVRDIGRPASSLDQGNFIDLGAVIVRRSVLHELHVPSQPGGPDGPFDTALERLSDWDLIQRLHARSEPRRIDVVGHVYEENSRHRISAEVPYGPAYHRVRSRIVGRPAEGLRVLLAEWHFPQVTETYLQADIEGLRALGAEVEVWSEEDVAVPYEPGLPWTRGTLEDHILAFRPNLVLSHWLHVGRDHRAVTRRLEIPHAVRCHGFDFDEGIVEELATDPGVVIHLFPHLAGSFRDRPNVVIDPVGFDPQRVAPTDDKDRRLVLRLAAGLHTKDLVTFMLAALRCPEHRFVLGIGHAYRGEERTEELVQLAHDLGSPVEIVLDASHEKAAALTMDAGIYLHTHGDAHPLGMPISPVEAMATGSVVLARELPGVEYLSGGALLYGGATPEARADHAASLINDTLHWTDERWATQARAALDVAWTRHPAGLVANDLLTTWRERLGVGVPGYDS